MYYEIDFKRTENDFMTFESVFIGSLSSMHSFHVVQCCLWSYGPSPSKVEGLFFNLNYYIRLRDIFEGDNAILCRAETAMQHVLRWASLEGEGTEYLRVDIDAGGTLAQGVVVGARGGQPYGLVYTVRLDADWRTRAVDIARPAEGQLLSVEADGVGRWRDARSGEHLPQLDGCIDVDIAATPFTNTLPIRRCQWANGQSRAFDMAYVSVPDLAMSKVRQRYTCIEQATKFLYENVPNDFQAELVIDAHGLVVDYPELFRRLP